jgi:hypothetical protein
MRARWLTRCRAPILADPQLEGLYATRASEFGPDIVDPATSRLWDITTPKQWGRLAARHTDPFGTGIPISTRAP